LLSEHVEYYHEIADAISLRTISEIMSAGLFLVAIICDVKYLEVTLSSTTTISRCRENIPCSLDVNVGVVFVNSSSSRFASSSVILAILCFTAYKTPKVTQLKDVSIRDDEDYGILYSAIKSKVDIFLTRDKDFLECGISKPRMNGTPHEDSDIDVGVVFNGFVGDHLKATQRLWRLRREISYDIEPHLLDTAHDPSGFAQHVVATGQVIYHA
jgi:hypothetical protein